MRDKAQVVREEVSYLGGFILKGQRKLTVDRKKYYMCCSPLLPLLLMPHTDLDPVLHDCLQTIDTKYSSCPDLKDSPLSNPDLEFFVGGSSLVWQGLWKVAYVMVTETDVVEVRSLPPHTSSQKDELIALTRALTLARGEKVNVYTDFRYAFGVLHAFGGLWRNRISDSRGRRDYAIERDTGFAYGGSTAC